MMRSMMFGAAVAIGLALAAPGQPPAQQRGDADVHYADLDLSRDADARTMLKRLELAADEACGRRPALRGNHPGLETFLATDFRECRTLALNNAVAELNAAKVTKLYAESRSQPHRLAGR